MVKVIAVVAIAAVATVEAQPEAKFVCNSANNSACGALIGYSHVNGTTLGDIQTLFNVKKLVDILGANNLPSNTTKRHVVGPSEVVKVPLPCRCLNGTGLSDRVPLYKIKKDDTLYNIATTTFGGLVKYPQITAANNIPDENNITAGATIYIPLPCSCDEVDGSRVVHYAHLVAAQSTVEGIAEQFGTSQQILLTLNGISDPKTLQAGQILDVPLQGNLPLSSHSLPLSIPSYANYDCASFQTHSQSQPTIILILFLLTFIHLFYLLTMILLSQIQNDLLFFFSFF